MRSPTSSAGWTGRSPTPARPGEPRAGAAWSAATSWSAPCRPVRPLGRAGRGGGDRRRRPLPGLDRRGAVHPRGSSSSWGPRARGGGQRPADRDGLRLGAGQPGGRARAARGRAPEARRASTSATSPPGRDGRRRDERRHARVGRRRHARARFAFRGGRLVTERARRPRAARSRSTAGAQGDLGRAPRSTSGCRARFPALRDVDVPAGLVRRRLRRAPRGLGAAPRSPRACPARPRRARHAHRPVVKGSTGGPDAEARSRVGLAGDRRGVRPRAAAGGHATVVLEGVNGYDFTAAMLAWSALYGGGRRPREGTARSGPSRPSAWTRSRRASARPDSSASAERSMHRRVVRHSPIKRPFRRKFGGPAPFT